jgi:hypothetical protein
MKTTVLHPLNHSLASNVYSRLEKSGKLMESHIHGDTFGKAKDIEGLPNTPRGLLNIVKKSRNREGEDAATGAGYDRSPDVSLLTARRVSVAPAAPQQHQMKQLQLSCMAAHPVEPFVVAGIGNGELAVYKLFRAHGERRPSLHQIQGFDASRNCHDIATALYVPPEPLAQEGTLRHTSFIAGFRSGRVAVFEIKVHTDKEPPLLLKHDHHNCDVLYVTWHMTHGIVSVAADGTALVADTAGHLVWSIHATLGPSVLITSADLAAEHEQLAVAGSRSVSLWQCLSQTHYGTIDAFQVPRSPVRLVRYLPSQHFLVTVHEGGGATLIWNAVRLELFRVLWSPSSSLLLPSGKTPCAVWISDWFQGDGAFLIFGPEGVTERCIRETGEIYLGPNGAGSNHEQR